MELIEQNLGKEAVKELLPMQPGDIPATSVDTTVLEATTQFAPQVSIEDGIRRFCGGFRFIILNPPLNMVFLTRESSEKRLNVRLCVFAQHLL